MQVVLELVEVEQHRVALVGRHGAAALGGLPQPCDDQGTEQSSRLTTQASLGQVDQHHSSAGEDLAQVEGTIDLTDETLDAASVRAR